MGIRLLGKILKGSLSLLAHRHPEPAKRLDLLLEHSVLTWWKEEDFTIFPYSSQSSGRIHRLRLEKVFQMVKYRYSAQDSQRSSLHKVGRVPHQAHIPGKLRFP